MLYYLGSTRFKVTMHAINEYVNQGLLSYFLTYVLIGVPIFIGTYVVDKKKNIFASLGLNRNILKGLFWSVVFTLPMFVGGLILYKLRTEGSIPNMIAGTVFAGFFEELYFRAFLFGLIFKHTKIGFIPAIILGAFVFATGHLYQSVDVNTQIQVFIITFLGAGFFAWLYVEWEYNLWIPILLHTLMNASWMIFDMSEHAAGNLYANILRGLTICFAIVGTLIYRHKTGKKIAVNKHTVWMKS